MKSTGFILISLITLFSLSTIAQDKGNVTATKKVKSEKQLKAFSIIEKGVLLSKVTIRKDPRASGNVIEIEALNVSGGSISLGNYSAGASEVMPPANISDITSITGDYSTTRDVSKSGRGVIMQLLDVNYPYRARITISEQILEFEIIESGFWKISVALSK